MDSEDVFLSKYNSLNDKLIDLSCKELFLKFNWNNLSFPIIDIDFFELFSNFVFHKKSYEIISELDYDEIKKLLNSGEIEDNSELINLKKTLKRIEEFQSPDLINEYYSQNTLAIFKNPKYYINRNNDFVFNSPVNNNDLIKKLDLINLKSQYNISENGIPNLYLVLGFVEYDTFNAPLILIPTSLKKIDNKYEVFFNDSQEIKFNKLLKRHLKRKNIDLPDFKINNETDLINYLSGVNDSISNIGKLKPIVALGLFDFNNIDISDDLDLSNWSDDAKSNLNYLLSDSTEPNNSIITEDKINLLKPDLNYNVYDADLSQMLFIEEAKLGEDLVLDASEKNKKYETIVNLISEIIANKKTVLYVSNKINSIKKLQEKLDNVNFNKFYLDLYANNFNNERFISEIEDSIDYNFEDITFNQDLFNSKVKEYSTIKSNFDEYINFLHTPFKNTNLTPYYLIGLKESNLNIIEESNSDLIDLKMNNISKLNQSDIKKLFSDVEEFIGFYLENISPAMKHKFNHISSMELSDKEFLDIIKFIPDIKNSLEDLIKLDNELNENYGIKKLDFLKNHNIYIDNINLLKNNPHVMGNDEETLEYFIKSLDEFQIKTKEFGSISDLEKFLSVEMYNTKNDLRKHMVELKKINEQIKNYEILLSKFEQELSNAGIKNLNSVNEIESSLNNFNLLTKNPAIVENETELDLFIDDIDKFQEKYNKHSLDSLLNIMNNNAKNALEKTFNHITKLISYKSNIASINDLITKILEFKKEIGLNTLNSINKMDVVVNKSNILRKKPMLIDESDNLETFHNNFKKGHDKFSKLSYGEYYNIMNDGVNKIQDDITSDLSNLSSLESNLPIIERELNNLEKNNLLLCDKILSNKISNLNQIDEIIDNIEIILKDPIIIKNEDKNEVDSYIKLIMDFSNDEGFTKLTIENVKSTIKFIKKIMHKLDNLDFKYSIMNLDLEKLYDTYYSDYKEFYAFPLYNAISDKQIKRKFEEFKESKDKLLKIFNVDYGKLKNELKKYYSIKAPNDDDIIIRDYNKFFKMKKNLEKQKNLILDYYNGNSSDFNDNKFNTIFNKLKDLKLDYSNNLKNVDDYIPPVKFEEKLSQLVLVKLKLENIKKMSTIDNKLGFYFPKSYLGLATNLEELLDDYVVNETFKQLMQNHFFKENVLSNFNSNELKEVLTQIKQSKSKILYYLTFINNNIDLKDSSLNFDKVFKLDFKELSNYCKDLFNEINEANNLFNEFLDNYEIKDINSIIDNFNKLNSLNLVKELINISKYKVPLIDYNQEYNALNNYNDMSKDYKYLIDKYYSTIWNGTKTSLKELSNQYNVYQMFTMMYEDKFFSDEVLIFLNNNINIDNKLNELNSTCNNLIKKVSDLNEELVFYNDDLSELDLIDFNKQNIHVLSIIDILTNYRESLSKYDSDNLISNNNHDDESINIICELHEELNNIYSNKDLSNFDISFDDEINNLKIIRDSKIKYLDIFSRKNSINQRNTIISTHFTHKNEKYNIWDGPLTSLSKLKDKVNIDKEFTELYNNQFYSDKTVDLIKNDVLYFNDFKSKIKEMLDNFEKIITNFNRYSILNEYSSNSNFHDIQDDTLKLNNDLNIIFNDYSNIKLNKQFDMHQALENIILSENIIKSDFINSLDMDLNILNKHLVDLNESSNKLTKLYELKKNFDDISIDLKYFDSIWDNYDTNVDDLKNQILINKKYDDLFSNGFFTEKINIIFKDSSKFDELFNLSDKKTSMVNKINKYFEKLDLIHISKGVQSHKNIEELYNYISFYNDNISDLENWRKFEKYCSNLENSGASEFISNIRKDKIENDVIFNTFKFNFANNLLDEINYDTDILTSFDGHNDINFNRLSDEIIQLNSMRVLNELKNIKPIFDGKIIDSNDITNQYKAYSSFINRTNDSIKDILKNSIDYIKILKPIFLMNPFSVSQFLDSSIFESFFDYVIYDDVEGCHVERSISSLLRGKTKIIIGNNAKSNPLSIFSLCKSKYKNKSLNWYYDSLEEYLIEDLNKKFYDDKLLIYPSLNESNKSKLILNKINDSTYTLNDNINIIEAEKIVEYAIEHVRKYGFEKTLGIITFNNSQKDLIIDILKTNLNNNPDLINFFNPLESFYINDINEVYESRDVLLVSLTYGFDENKKLNIDKNIFNKNNCKTLLSNVNEDMIIFSNFNCGDLKNNCEDLDKFNSLYNLLCLFEKTSIPELNKPDLTLFEESVYDFLINNGYQVKKQIGYNNHYIDLVIMDNENTNNYSIALECDGNNYNKFKLTKDRIKLHLDLLKNLGWNYLHIYANEWNNSREEYQKLLLEKIKVLFTEEPSEIDIDNLDIDLEDIDIDIEDIDMGEEIEINLDNTINNDYSLNVEYLVELLRM